MSRAVLVKPPASAGCLAHQTTLTFPLWCVGPTAPFGSVFWRFHAWPRLASAAEVTSNGTGGGKWDDPATWRTKAVPAPGDDVVIAKDDVIVFDRANDGKVACKQLFLDPRGKLTFKTGGNRLFCVNGPIESHGTIHLDASASADDLFELRLVAAKVEDREIRLKKGACLTLLGRRKLAEGKRNVIVSSKPPMVKPTDPAPAVGSLLTKETGVSIELPACAV